MKSKFGWLFLLVFGLAGCAADELGGRPDKDNWRLPEPTIQTYLGGVDGVFQPREGTFSLKDSLSFGQAGSGQLKDPIDWIVESRCDHAATGERGYRRTLQTQSAQFPFYELIPEEALVLSVQNPGALRCYFSIVGKNSSGSTHRFETPWLVFRDADSFSSNGFQLVDRESGSSLSNEDLVLDESLLSRYSLRGLPDLAGETQISCETFFIRLETQSLRDTNLDEVLSLGVADPMIQELPWRARPLQKCRLIWMESATGKIHYSAAHPFRFLQEPVRITTHWKQLSTPNARKFPAGHALFPKAKKTFLAYGADVELEVEIYNPNPAPVQADTTDLHKLKLTGQVLKHTRLGKKKKHLSSDEMGVAFSFQPDQSTDLSQPLEIPPHESVILKMVFEYGFLCFDYSMYIKIDESATRTTWGLTKELKIPITYANGTQQNAVTNAPIKKSTTEYKVECKDLNFAEFLKK